MSEPAQLGAEDVAGLTPEQIVKAREKGQLREYMGPGRSPLDGWSPDEIVAAREEGRLAAYLAGGAPPAGPAAAPGAGKGGVPLP